MSLMSVDFSGTKKISPAVHKFLIAGRAAVSKEQHKV